MMGHKRLLIIENDIDMVEAMRVVLGKDYFIDNAFSADEGLQKLEIEKPDLVIISVMFGSLKKPDGIRLAVKLKQDRLLSQIPVLMVTAVDVSALDFVFSASDRTELRVDGFLNKPFQPAEIRTLVEKLLSTGGRETNWRQE